MRPFLYFLLYVLAGPALGLVAAVAWLSLLSADNLWDSGLGAYSGIILPLAYLIGGIPAALVGFAAAFQLHRRGRSRLVVNLPLALTASLLSSKFIMFIAGWDFHILVMASAVLASVVLRVSEPAFRRRAAP